MKHNNSAISTSLFPFVFGFKQTGASIPVKMISKAEFCIGEIGRQKEYEKGFPEPESRREKNLDMNTLINIWTGYQICYAIGYMLFVRPPIQKRVAGGALLKWIDYLFYISLLLFSTLKYFSS